MKENWNLFVITGAGVYLYYLEGKEYVLAMNMPYKEKDKHIYQIFWKKYRK